MAISNFIWIIVILSLVVIAEGFIGYFLIKNISKIKDENERLSKAVKQQKEIISAFIKAESDAKKKKDKLGNGTDDERLNTSLDILQDIEFRR